VVYFLKPVENNNLFNQPLVSIIIPHWNGKKILKLCLQSLICQTYPNYEIIVVDNASTDGSPDMVKKEFQKVKLIINKKNLGWAGGCNVGIKTARGDLIALFNNDAIADPKWLSELVNVIKNSLKIGIVGGVVFYYEPGDIIDDAGLKMDPITGIVWHVNRGKRLVRLEELQHVDFVSGVDLLVKRELIEKIGMFDEGYPLYHEETDFGLRAQRAGYECKIVPSAFVQHMGCVTVKKLPLKGYYLKSKSDFRFYFKNLPLKYLFTALFFQLILVPSVESLLFKNPIFFWLKMKAFIWNFLRLREIVAKRRENECLGKIKLKNRLKECLKIAIHRSYNY
jgi:hypothetical protein